MSQRLTEQEVADSMSAVGVEPIDPYPGTVTVKFRVKCLVHDAFVWETTLQRLRHSGRGPGCAKCARHSAAKANSLSTDVVVDYLADRGIQLIRYGGTTHARSRFRCVSDGHEWETKLGSIRSGSGCPECGNRRGGARLRLDSAEIAADLAKRNIRIVRYGGTTSERSTFQCYKASHEWETQLSSIRCGSGCPECAKADLGRRALGGDVVARTLANANVQPIDRYPGKVAAKFRVACLADNCGHVWATTLSYLRRGCGCPLCGRKRSAQKRRLGRDEVEESLTQSRVEATESHPGNVHDKFRVRCLTSDCGHVWESALSYLRSGYGCPKCAGVARISNEEAAANLADALMEAIDPYPGSATTKFRVRCVTDGYEWGTTLSRVRKGHGCRACAKYGFDLTSPAVLYLIKHQRLGAAKIGVSRLDRDRLRIHEKHGWEQVALSDFDTGAQAYEAEQDVLAKWEGDGLPLGFVAREDMPQGGYTETTSLALIDLDQARAHVTRMGLG